MVETGFVISISLSRPPIIVQGILISLKEPTRRKRLAKLFFSLTAETFRNNYFPISQSQGKKTTLKDRHTPVIESNKSICCSGKINGYLIYNTSIKSMRWKGGRKGEGGGGGVNQT